MKNFKEREREKNHKFRQMLYEKFLFSNSGNFLLTKWNKSFILNVKNVFKMKIGHGDAVVFTSKGNANLLQHTHNQTVRRVQPFDGMGMEY